MEKKRGILRWVARGAVTLLVLYTVFFGVVAAAMLQPPDRFGRIMRRMPQALIWMLLPAPSMWLWARSGNLEVGDTAPDFTLPAQDGSGDVTLSSHRGQRPVVLVFGSYT